MSKGEHSGYRIEVASGKHIHFASEISRTMEESAQARGTGIGKRPPELLIRYMLEGKAVVAVTDDGRWAGFSYLALWDNGKYVSNSGLIVAPEFRERGVAKKIKEKIFELSRKKYPGSIIVGITTSEAVMKMNTSLGFVPTTFSQLPADGEFWNGCKGCVNHDILERSKGKYCLCTAMRFNPASMINEGVRQAAILSEEFH